MHTATNFTYRADTLPGMDFPGRLERLRQNLGQDFDALLISHLPNVRYLCGFTGSAATLLITDTNATFFTDGRYTEQAKSEVQAARVIISRKNPLLRAAEWVASKLRRKNIVTIGVEGEHLTLVMRRQLRQALPPQFRLRQAPLWAEQQRMIKDADELGLIRNAVQLGAGLFDVALMTMRPGIDEVAVAAEMEYAARKQGAEAMSFETIIASGPRSAMPHARASRSTINPGTFVVCDFGVILAGYCSDMTRTAFVGRCPRQARALYEAVYDAQQAALEAVRPGITVGEVDSAARNLLRKSKLARYFTHSTGHGVGLEIHEAPRVAAMNHEVLRPGMVITIEPGAYIPGKWGVRIEDMVVVTKGSCEVLTSASKELITI